MYNDIRKRYIEKFFSNLTDEEKKDIYFEDFIWHAFSCNKVKSVEGTVAIEKFKKHNKNNVYILFQNKDVVLEKNNITYEELIDIIKEDIWDNMDCYVIDREFNWTFVCTHETYIPNELDFIDEENRNFEEFPSIGPFFAERIDK